MPRPSLKEERSAEILKAYERCIARYGVEGATLEKTAEEAGLARALIRHNVGNKDDLLDAFIDRFLAKANEDSNTLFTSLPQDERVSTLIDWLFDPQYSDPHDVMVTSALVTAAIDRPALAKRLRDWILAFIASVAAILRNAFPDAQDKRAEAVANGIVSIYFNVDTLAALGQMTEFRRSSEAAARLLVSTLEH